MVSPTDYLDGVGKTIIDNGELRSAGGEGFGHYFFKPIGAIHTKASEAEVREGGDDGLDGIDDDSMPDWFRNLANENDYL